MAVTHDDLTPSPKSSHLGSKTGVSIMIFSILLGLFCFILCLLADATRSEVKWTATDDRGKGIESKCTFTGSGKLPLLSAAAAFFALAIAMVVQHTHLLVAVGRSHYLVEMSWDPDSAIARTLTWQIGFFFVSTWTSFAVGEILLLTGVSVESGHLKNWSRPRPNCLTIRQGMFTAGGVFGMATVFLASGLYITALRVEMYLQEQLNHTRREVMEASSTTHASPPPGGRSTIITGAEDDPLHRQQQVLNGYSQNNTLYYYLTAFDKQSSLV
ncbi:hypothetical protein OROGR_025279 [Orobanche gracilis]